MCHLKQSKSRLLFTVLGFLSFSAIYCQSYILVDKPNLKLLVISNRDTLFHTPISCGKRLGQKTIENDYKTPEGKFIISQIQDSSKWEHDFRDGNGIIPNAYGPVFIRLETGKWKGIGIHGTCFPESIGTRDSEGCIRLRNEDVIKLKEMVKIGMEVVILSDDILE